MLSLWLYFHSKIVYDQLKRPVPTASRVALALIPPIFLLVVWSLAPVGVLLNRDRYYQMCGVALSATILCYMLLLGFTYLALR